jgi:uncharacterized protein YjiS (DUF1127 family)
MQPQDPSLALDGTHLAAAMRPRYSMLELVRAIAAAVGDAFTAWRRMRRAKATRDALATLDDRMLRDLGIARDEIGSISAEVAGQVERTRVHAMLLPIGL